MIRFVNYVIKNIMIAVIMALMILFTGAVAGAEQLEAKEQLTIAPLWYQPHVLASIDEAAGTLNNFKSLFSDWEGFEIKQLSADISGVRFVAVLNSSENAISIPAKDITDLKLLYFPFLERETNGVWISALATGLRSPCGLRLWMQPKKSLIPWPL